MAKSILFTLIWMVLQLKTDAVYLFHDFSQKTRFFFLFLKKKKTQKIYFQYVF